MRGFSDEQLGMFSYVSVEDRIPADHPLRAIRKLVDRALVQISTHLACCYSHTGRPSIAPERLLRALLLQVFYSIRSERQLMEQLDYNLLYRWFVGLSHCWPSPTPGSLVAKSAGFRPASGAARTSGCARSDRGTD